MGRTANKPTAAAVSPQLEVQRQDGKIWSHIRQKWLNETPEEKVRQEYLCVLVNEYGFALEQMAEEESVTGRGSGQARRFHHLAHCAGQCR
jgi:type I restriction enzyme M protein